MEEIRAQVVSRLGELRSIGIPKPTASSLREGGNLGRIHRRELKKYQMDINRQDVRLTKRLSEIDKYLQSVSDYEDYVASSSVSPLVSFSTRNGTEPVPASVPAPVVLPKPVVVIGLKPAFKKTKFSRYFR